MMSARHSRSGLEELPRELLARIFSAFDTPSILKCASLSTTLNTIGIDVALRRTGVPDPTSYCKVTALLRRTYQPPPADALAALLMNAQPLKHTKHLHCTIQFDDDPRLLDTAYCLEYCPGQLPDSPEITSVLALQRLNLLLTKIEAVDGVTLDLSGLKYGLIAQTVNGNLAHLIHSVIQKGCRTLEIKCPESPFGDDPKVWTFPIPDSNITKLPKTGRFAVSSILSSFFSLRGLFSPKPPTRKDGHRRLKSESSILSSPQSTLTHEKIKPLQRQRAIHPRVSTLDVDSTFFHPTGSAWLSNFLSYSPLTTLTIYLTSSPSSAVIIEHGLKTLQQTVGSRLQSLTLLNVDALHTLERIMPRLRLFSSLKHLSIRLDPTSRRNALAETTGKEMQTPFAPGNLERLSVPPQLIDYMLLGTVTALRIAEFEILYDLPNAVPEMSTHVAKVREFYAKIGVPMRIIVTLDCVCSWSSSSAHDTRSGILNGEDEREERVSGSSVSADLANLFENTQFTNLTAVDTLQLELAPSSLQAPGCVDDMLRLLAFFPMVNNVHLREGTDFRRAETPLVVPLDVRQSVVQPVYGACRELKVLRVGGEVYDRPLVQI